MTVTVLMLTFAVVTQLTSATPTYDNVHQDDVIRDVESNVVRKGTDSVLMQVLLTLSRLQNDMAELKTSMSKSTQSVVQLKTEVTELKSSVSTSSQSVAKLTNKVETLESSLDTSNKEITSAQTAYQTSTKQLQKDVTDIKSAMKKAHDPPKKVCPADFTYIAAINGCYKVVLDKLEWSVAALRCRSLHKDAHLVFIDNATEQRHIASLLAYHGSKTYYCWTGGQRIDPSRASTFVWKKNPCGCSAETTEEMLEITYTNWYTGQPSYAINSKNDQACLGLHRSWHYSWDDGGCQNRQCSVCELDL